jgi:glutamyl-tRNA reductase
LCRAAIHAGKRARTETGIGVNSVSISSVAANLAGRLLGNLPERQVVLIGAGEMGAIAVRALAQRGLTQVTVVNRTYEKAEQLAQSWNGLAATFQQLPTLLRTADIVITSTGAPHTILNSELLAPVMETRPNRPLFLIDIAVPRDVDPEVARLPHVYLYDIDDLQEQATQNIREREAEIPRVEAIVMEEVVTFMTWLASLEATSTISNLRQKVEEVRQQELERLFKRLNLTEQEQSLVTAMSQRLINKILHEPTLCLKQETANGNGAAFISATRQLFALDQRVEEESLINPKERISCDNSFASLATI